MLKYIGDYIHVFIEIIDKNSAGNDGSGNRFGNFRFAAAGYGARFMAESAFLMGADQAPAGRSRVAFHMDFKAVGIDIGVAEQQFERMRLPVMRPADLLLLEC